MRSPITRRNCTAVLGLFMIAPVLAKTPDGKLAAKGLHRESQHSSVSLDGDQFDPQRLLSHVALLAHDELGGRGTGSHGIDLAAGYIAGQFAAAGVLPGGPDGTYFQNFDVVFGGTMSDATAFSCAKIDKSFTAGEDFLPFSFSSPDAFSGEVAFVGYGVAAPDEKYDDYADFDVSGKVALMIRREPEFLSPDGGATSHATFESKMKLAKEHGAVAVLIANRDDGDDADQLRRFRPRGATYDLPAIHVTRKLANALLEEANLPTITKLQAQIEESKTSISKTMKGVVVDGTVAYDLETKLGRNVIGLLPGDGADADKYIVIGGHYDHLGTRGGDIYNGADDNASGTAGVIELARKFAKDTHRNRSILFMAYAGEEMGLLGSKHYISDPTVPLDDIVAMINMDMIGKLKQNGDGKRLTVHGLGTGSSFKGLVEKHAADAGLTYDADDSARGPSDHASFYEGGVPALFFFTGVHEDYHQPGDDTDKIDFEGAARILGLVKNVASDLVNAEAGPVFAKVDHRAIIKFGRRGGPPRVVMGIMPDMEDSGDGGWRIARVFPESGALEAGMKSGDRIIKIEGATIGGLQDYRKVIKGKKPGDVIVVTVRRGDEQLDLSVKLSAG
jgi:Peptidase family M28/PDZ domain/PA domain